MKILVTGAAGFIGSNLCRYLLNDCSHSVVALDNLTYAGNLTSLDDMRDNDAFEFIQADVCDEKALNGILFNHESPRRGEIAEIKASELGIGKTKLQAVATADDGSTVASFPLDVEITR